jgi:hypothetical protein
MKNIKGSSSRKPGLSREQQTRRLQQIVLSIFGLIVVLSMIISLVAR